jgi:PAS domain S-box-containing protein
LWHGRNFRSKLLIQSLAAAGFALFIAACLFIAISHISMRSNILNRLEVSADIVGGQITAAISFNDPATAEEALSELNADPLIVSAQVYLPDGSIFARFNRYDDSQAFIMPERASQDAYIQGDIAHVIRPISPNSPELGELYLCRKLNDLQQHNTLLLMAGAGSTLLALLLIWPLINHLQNLLIRPVSELSKAARHVTQSRDFSVRAEKYTDDELGLLTDAFNRMLSEIEERNTKLTLSEAKFRGITENTSDFTLLLDRDHKCAYHTATVADAFGKERKDLIGTPISELIARDDLSAFQSALKEAEEQESVTVRVSNVRLKRPSTRSSHIHLECAITCLHNMPGVSGIVVNGHDITNLIESERVLRAAKESAEAGSLAKSEFLAVMNHELRTPMNAVLGFAQMMDFTDSDDERQLYARRIVESGNNLMKLIEKILDYSRISSSKVDLDCSWESPIDLVTSTFSDIEEQYNEIDWKLELDSPFPESIFIDTVYFRQILSNLLNNAGRFTKQGKIRVCASYARSDSRREELRLSVHDTGPGIPINKIQAVFEPFRQADYSITRAYGGTGLGLAICSRLVHAMGGALVYNTGEEKGAHFYLYIPVKSREQEQEITQKKCRLPDTAETTSPNDSTILIAEDDAANQEIIKTLLKKAGYACTIVSDGKELIDTLGKQSYRLVLMDVAMPKMGGHEATRLVREGACGVQKQRIPIIGVSAFTTKQDRELCLNAGMDDWLQKPIRYPELVEKINRYH